MVLAFSLTEYTLGKLLNPVAQKPNSKQIYLGSFKNAYYYFVHLEISWSRNWRISFLTSYWTDFCTTHKKQLIDCMLEPLTQYF